ncbi:YdcF family protein [Sphaerotilus uruguayifluvii]|uniref:Uncharacterized SAM-binding protein YcdF (DUF218 family) n=1 Tax=Sphaerotilus uruguayifluvii TaxID=2735897 RepID=A0ABX2G5B6_9BURK|nr:uncharacterized SAM-binding protein YcdF (DUF218 family) [Leptothrix sp. C29]
MLDPSWKPTLSALIQPPASLLLMIPAGLWALRWRRWAGRLMISLATLGLWLMCCSGSAQWLQDHVLRPPSALSAPEIRALMRAPGTPPTAIVVLGAGRHRLSPEYGSSMLTQQAMVRLHYGVWLARRTGQPLAYSGGVGWGQSGETTEAETAARILMDDYGSRLRWTESRSRDTRENAERLVPMLQADGVRRIILVTHASHMPRAMRAFRDAAGRQISIVAAPVGFVTNDESGLLDWIPSSYGYRLVHDALHEVLGLITGN